MIPPETAPPEDAAGPTFFERAGGEPGIRAAVTALYEQLFEDPMVGFLFAGHDRARIIDQQVVFTSRMLGADVAYTGKPLPEAHQSSPILPGHFDRRHHLLRTTLLAQGMDEAPREAWLRLDAALRPVILKQGQIRIEALRQVRLLNQLRDARTAKPPRPQATPEGRSPPRRPKGGAPATPEGRSPRDARRAKPPRRPKGGAPRDARRAEPEPIPTATKGR